MSNRTHFDESYVKPLLADYKGNEIFEKTISKISPGDSMQLIRVLARYVKFNEPFGAGAVVLAGNIADRNDLFRTMGGHLFSDRSYEVARYIYAATPDEFGCSGKGNRTHREAAKVMLRDAGMLYNHGPDSIESFIDLSGPTSDAIEKIRHGYGLNRLVNDEDLFTGIGHHIASESLADDEFYRLNRVLRTTRSHLVSRLEQDHEYFWISIHGGKETEHSGVEMDHYKAALKAADLALFYYAGNMKESELRNLVLHGFKNFMKMHIEFMSHIAD